MEKINKIIPYELIAIMLIAIWLFQSCGETSIRDFDSTVTLKNDNMEVTISKDRGTITRLLNIEDSVDYCHEVVGRVGQYENVPVGDRIGGVILHDELENKVYSDFDSKTRISEFNYDEKNGEISFLKSFQGAHFQLQETFLLKEDHLRWEVKVLKTKGSDRSIKITQFLPLPSGEYQGWAPIADVPFDISPLKPFQIVYGITDGGATGSSIDRTIIPMMTFYNSRDKNALVVVSPFEIPSVRIRFKNNIENTVDFHWNSRNYAIKERPYLQVISEYLGLRDDNPAKTGLLITIQPGQCWRPSLGWVYDQYREYFDPYPGFEKYDGAYVIDVPMPDNLSSKEQDKLFQRLAELGIRWEELHGHFPQYGEMIPPDSQNLWKNASHPKEGVTISRKKVADHATKAKQAGTGTFIYYNNTEAEWWYAKEKYPESIALDEQGKPIIAFKGASYPDQRACWLKNSDPNTQFGKDLLSQAEEMVKAYPNMGGFFWDVYGRTYSFDFAHDDGITMVNNKPAYASIFMFLRSMEKIGPLLHENGMFITANKPTTISVCKGLDGIMTRESVPALNDPWTIASSYTGLNRHIMVLDGNAWQHPERMFLNCLRFGMFYSMLNTEGISAPEFIKKEDIQKKEEAEKWRDIYHPIIDKFRGKKWIFYPKVLELPEMTDGNIFRLDDGSVMITMTSLWRELENIPGTTPNLTITCLLPDALEFTRFKVLQPDISQVSLLGKYNHLNEMGIC